MSVDIVYDRQALGIKVAQFNTNCVNRTDMKSRFERVTAEAMYRKMELQNWRCQYCKRVVSFSNCTFDHVYPLNRGGDHTPHNIVIACGHCNTSKNDRKLSYWCKKTKRRFLKIMAKIDDINVQLENEGLIGVYVKEVELDNE